ncbi:MAG: hypothetical protein KGY70_11490 [Bacteroidales bacterium]|nr:hypothetical protein [Bacteroidales bacterium]
MKIQLDYDNKMLTVENNVNLGELMEKIKQVLPDWKKWTLETKTEVIWNNPVVVREPYNPYYFNWPIIWCDDSTAGVSIDNTFTGYQKVQLEIQ